MEPGTAENFVMANKMEWGSTVGQTDADMQANGDKEEFTEWGSWSILMGDRTPENTNKMKKTVSV